MLKLDIVSFLTPLRLLSRRLYMLSSYRFICNHAGQSLFAYSALRFCGAAIIQIDLADWRRGGVRLFKSFRTRGLTPSISGRGAVDRPS